MATYRITFTGGPDSDIIKNYNVIANDSVEAFHIAYEKPEAKQRWKYANVWVSKVEDGPKVIGICFVSLFRNHAYDQYMFIRADNEEQAKRFYIKHFEGKHYFDSKPKEPDENGNCTYGAIRYSYYATTDRYDFDVT